MSIIRTDYKCIRDVPWYVEQETKRLLALGWKLEGGRHIATPEGTCQPMAVQALRLEIRCPG